MNPLAIVCSISSSIIALDRNVNRNKSKLYIYQNDVFYRRLPRNHWTRCASGWPVRKPRFRVLRRPRSQGLQRVRTVEDQPTRSICNNQNGRLAMSRYRLSGSLVMSQSKLSAKIVRQKCQNQIFGMTLCLIREISKTTDTYWLFVNTRFLFLKTLFLSGPNI